MNVNTVAYPLLAHTKQPKKKMNNLFTTREHGKLNNGVSYVILQDGPNSFHVTVNNKHLYYYEYFSPNSIEELRNGIDNLSNELLTEYTREDLTSDADQGILHHISDEPLNNNSTNKEETNDF